MKGFAPCRWPLSCGCLLAGLLACWLAGFLASGRHCDPLCYLDSFGLAVASILEALGTPQ